MKLIILLLVISSSFSSFANTQIERLNFYPIAKHFSYARYNYEKTKIDSQVRVLGTEELNNFLNTIYLSYAYNYSKSFFVGITLPYQSAVESGVRFGVPVSEKVRSNGFKEPELFTIIRLREETQEHGLIHLYLSYSNKFGDAKVGRKNPNRLAGRNIFKSELSHGRKQEQWEFKTYVRYEYFGNGSEMDLSIGNKITLSPYSDLKIGFKTQYNLSESLSYLAGIGLIYRGTRHMEVKNGSKREVQAGTGSIFELGAKYRLDEKNLVEVNSSLERNDYFVKGDENNFDGRAAIYQLGVNYIRTY